MELDKRIIEGKKPLTCFDLKEASGFLKKTGYFANELDYFSDLSKVTTDCCSEIYYGKLLGIKDKRCVFKYLSMDCSRESSYRFFLPEDWVLPAEKKYRAYTLEEWIEKHEIGEVIHYRSKSGEVELRHMYVGTRHSQGIKKTILKITLGNVSHTLDYLFENYEIEVDGKWKPFGIEVEENE